MTNHDVIVGNNLPATDCSQDSDCASDVAVVDSNHIHRDDVTIQDGGAVVPSESGAGAHGALSPVGDLPYVVRNAHARASGQGSAN